MIAIVMMVFCISGIIFSLLSKNFSAAIWAFNTLMWVVIAESK